MSNVISIVINGDKTKFVSKGALERFKRDLRTNTTLENDKYFTNGWGYTIVNSDSNNYNVNIVEIKTHESKMNELRDKLKAKIAKKTPLSQEKLNLKNKVPDDIYNAYINLKKLNNMNAPILSPDQVLEKPDEYKNILQTTIANFKGNNNPVINYYKLLAKKLNINTVEPEQNEVQPEVLPTIDTSFLKNLKEQVEMDDEMRSIYKTLGIKSEDNEMMKIYESLGV